MTQQPSEPNLYYELAGDGLQLTYISRNNQGQPELSFQEPDGSRTTMEVHPETSELGTLISTGWRIILAVEEKSNFVLLLPAVDLAGTTEQPIEIETLAISTSIVNLTIGLTEPRQIQTYRVHTLHGTARLATTTDPVTLNVDTVSYQIGDPINVTLSNQSSQTISFPDHLSECSVIQLQRQEDGNWTNVYPCLHGGVATFEHHLEAGQRLTVKLGSSSGSAGLYRATLSYRTSEAPEQRTIYSQEFEVRANPEGH